MLTLHAAGAVLGAGAETALVGTGRGDAVPAAVDRADAVLVDGDVIVGLGTLAALTAAAPRARVRRWPGLITPGLVNHRAAALLEHAYHPDPREAAELGTEPLTGDALARLAMDEARWGASARRGLQRMLRLGTTAVVGPFHRPAVRTAVARSGLRLLAEPDAADGSGSTAGSGSAAEAMDVLAAGPPHAVLGGRIAPGEPADLAVFDVPTDPAPAAAPHELDARTCVATVLGGRLVYRRR